MALQIQDELLSKGATLISFPADDEGETSDEFFFKEPFAPSEFDLPEGPLLRFQAYRKSWHNCLERIKEIVRVLQRPVVEEITQTVEYSYSQTVESPILPEPELLTVILSSSDRSYVHRCLSDVLNSLQRTSDQTQNIPNSIVCQVSATDCTSLVNIMKAIISGFISHPLTGPSKKLRTTSLANHDVKVLKSWYEAIHSRLGDETPQLVISIDVHSVEAPILRDMFEICSNLIPSVPLVFLLESIDANYLHNVLPRTTLSHLRIERHNVISDSNTLEYIIKETFFTPKFLPDVMLGPKGMEIVLQEFQRHNATLDGLISTLQLLYMHHFYHPLSILSNSDNDSFLYEIFDEEQDWKPFMKLLRQRFISHDMDEETWTDLSPDKVLHDAITAREKYKGHLVDIAIIVQLVDAIAKYCSGRLARFPEVSFRNLALNILNGELQEVSSKLKQMCDVLGKSHPVHILALYEELYMYVNNVPAVARPAVAGTKKHLVQAINNQTTKAVFFNSLAEDLCQKLVPLEDIPCHDIWWTGVSTIPNSPFNPNPHISIVTSLIDTHTYLGWDHKGEITGADSASLVPDTCLLFRRYLESGRMINIYDWYQTFAVALDQDEESGDRMDVDETPTKKTAVNVSPQKRRGRPPKNAQPQLKVMETPATTRKHTSNDGARLTQARFLRAMAELEFVGFLKHTGRKSDHVLKTAFDLLE